MAHLNFQAGIRAEYYKDNGDDATILLWLNDFMLSNTSDEIGFTHEELLRVIPDTLSEHEEDTLLNWFADNYGTPYEEWYSGDADIIRQCTGLKDMTGKLIYEGDIVRESPYNKYFEYADYVVSWKDGAYTNEKCLGMKNKETGEIKDCSKGGYCFSKHIHQEVADDFEVIGNIHENPELIGGNHD